MQVYKIEKRLSIIRFQALETSLVFDVNVSCRKRAIRYKTEFIFAICSHVVCHSMNQGLSRLNVNSTWSRTPLSITARNSKRARLAAFDKIRNVFFFHYRMLR